MIGVLLVNMGSPSSKKEMRTFLFNMFRDKAILPFPLVPRCLLAFLISNFRYRSSWKKYEQIGGSNLIDSMNQISRDLSAALGSNYRVSTAYSYTFPRIKDGIKMLHDQGIRAIKIITMYPQSGFSTTGSVRNDLAKGTHVFPDLRISMMGTYYDNPLFISYWVDLIQATIKQQAYISPTLLFSAHAIPVYQIKKGDTYTDQINHSAKAIATQLGLQYEVAYQSKIGRIEWVGPDTKDCLKTMQTAGILQEIILVPLSFVNENLETAYDLDLEIIPFAKQVLGIQTICRVVIPASHPFLITTFKQILAES